MEAAVVDSVFGSGLAVPAVISTQGALSLKTGDDRLLDAVEAILCTPLGSCPMDPTFGFDIDAYDPINDVTELAWAMTRAIEHGEPRISRVDAIVESIDITNGTVYIRIEITPSNGTTPLTRTFPFYRKE